MKLEKILSDRDEKIRRIELATETRRKQYTAKTQEELDNIPSVLTSNSLSQHSNLVYFTFFIYLTLVL